MGAVAGFFVDGAATEGGEQAWSRGIRCLAQKSERHVGQVIRTATRRV
jgi:hypothetical protein